MTSGNYLAMRNIIDAIRKESQNKACNKKHMNCNAKKLTTKRNKYASNN
jgi:hypothetical protein